MSDCLNYFFFFSSRRRHTRLQGDWSSDVCSSDLLPVPLREMAQGSRGGAPEGDRRGGAPRQRAEEERSRAGQEREPGAPAEDRKSTRLNSSHLVISYAVFCLKKKKKKRMRRYSVD